ncbi:MAG: cytochrome c [Chloroflexi bacterium]|nr:cytochrome c [Chloroflexota bacterium]
MSAFSRRGNGVRFATFLALCLLTVVLFALPFISDGREGSSPSYRPTLPAAPSSLQGLTGAALGHALAEMYCASCHQPSSPYSAKTIGPGWRGLYGSTVTLSDGSRVQVDEAYLRRAIVTPATEAVAGYVPTHMYGVWLTLTDAQVDALVEYVKSLR